MRAFVIVVISVCFSLSCKEGGAPYDVSNVRNSNDSIPVLLKLHVKPDSLNESDEDSVDLYEVQILNLFDKLESKRKLGSEEYRFLAELLINGCYYESDSENLGTLLYKYFKRNRGANLAFNEYIYQNSKDPNDIYTQLIMQMCIDIADNDASFSSFLGDFIMFSNEPSIEACYNNCINGE
jgi:hypothetical protein